MRYQPWLENQNWTEHDPKLSEARKQPVQLTHTLNLARQITLEPPGILIVRGPRQVGKSTFLREFAAECLKELKPESIVLYDAERYGSRHELAAEIENYLKERTGYRVILIDEITSMEKWWLILKTTADRGLLADTLILCTGSSSEDLAEGADLMPGRRGKRHPVDFELLPVSYRDISEKLSVNEFLLTGGFPWAINEYLKLGTIPSYVYQLYASWLEGGIYKKHRLRQHLKYLLNKLAEKQCTPVSITKLSRDCGIGSNSTAESLISTLEQLYAIIPCYWADIPQDVPAPRKNRKLYPMDPFLFHLFTEFGMGWDMAFQESVKRIEDPECMGKLVQGLAASEIRHRIEAQQLHFWIGKKEIDFTGGDFIEVKYQEHVTIEEFSWARKVLPKGGNLTVITKKTNAEDTGIRLVDLRRWLME